MNKKQIGAVASVIVLLLVTTIGLSFAYFTANLSGGETATTIEVSGGVMSIVYADHNPIIAVDNIIPDNNPAAIKSFTVTGTNSTDLEMGYGVSLVVNENTFSNGAITYRLESTNSGSNGQTASSIVTNKPIKTGVGTYKLGQGYFTNGTGKVHSYELKIYFLETGNLQNEDQGKTFKAHVGITDASNSLQIAPAQVGDNAYAKLEVNGDLVVYGTGATWDFGSKLDEPASVSIIYSVMGSYFGHVAFAQLFYDINANPSQKEVYLNYPQAEIEPILIDWGTTYEDYLNFLDRVDSYEQPLISGNVIIEEGITKLGEESLRRLYLKDLYDEDDYFTSITLPNTLEEIGVRALYENKITTLTIPNNVKIIDRGAFRNNEINTLILGNNIETIGESAFERNNFTAVTIPESVTTIGLYAFSEDMYYSSNVTEVTMLGSNPTRFNSIWNDIGFQNATMP